MLNPSPQPPSSPRIPTVGTVRRGVLSHIPVLSTANPAFSGYIKNGKIPLQMLMKGGIRRVNSTGRQKLGLRTSQSIA